MKLISNGVFSNYIEISRYFFQNRLLQLLHIKLISNGVFSNYFEGGVLPTVTGRASSTVREPIRAACSSAVLDIPQVRTQVVTEILHWLPRFFIDYRDSSLTTEILHWLIYCTYCMRCLYTDESQCQYHLVFFFFFVATECGYTLVD